MRSSFGELASTEVPLEARGPPRPRPLGWLRSQGLGLLCGFATVALLAAGSVVLTATREGASAGVQMDDLRAFFAPPRAAHAWLYLLFAVAALYALNTVLATWDTVSRKWRGGIRAPSAYAASLVHIGFLLALLAHAVGGFFGNDGDGVVIASGWQEVPGFGEARLVSLEVDPLPDGTPRSATARLELRDAAGGMRAATVGYNEPLASAGGARLALLSDLGRTLVARFASGGESCVLAEGQGCRIGGEAVKLLGFTAGRGGVPSAVVRARGPSLSDEVWTIGRDAELVLASGRTLQLDAIAREPAVVLRARAAPGNPWALAASLMMAAGVVLLWRKLAR